MEVEVFVRQRSRNASWLIPEGFFWSLPQMQTLREKKTQSFIELTLKIDPKWHSLAVFYCFVKLLDSSLLFPCCFYYLGAQCNASFCVLAFPRLSSSRPSPTSFSRLSSFLPPAFWPPSVSLSAWLALVFPCTCFPASCACTCCIILGRFWHDIKLYSYKATLWWASWGKSLRSGVRLLYRGRQVSA